MNSIKARGIAVRIYDNVHAAVWAASLAFAIWFVAIVVPRIPEARAQAETQRIHEIATEHEFYCQKWGKGAGSQLHAQCILDLQAFRAGVEQRLAVEADF
jgi:hypothetical protein